MIVITAEPWPDATNVKVHVRTTQYNVLTPARYRAFEVDLDERESARNNDTYVTVDGYWIPAQRIVAALAATLKRRQ